MAVRTLHVITDRDRRGAQVHALDLSEGLRLAGVDADVVALAPGKHGDLLAVEALGSARLTPVALRNLRQHSRRYDVVVAHGSTTLIACAAAVHPKVPFVYRQISDPLFWAGSWRRRIQTGLLLRRASSIVVLSDDVGAVFAAHYRLPRRELVTIPNAVPRAQWPMVTQQERLSARSALGLPADAAIGGFMGALVREKGADTAIRAIAAVPAAHLVILGEGPEHGLLRSLGERLAPQRVHFIGSTDQPRTILAAVDLLLLPSRGGDSMPAVLIEAGLCGIPSVATPVGAITGVVADHVTGRVVPIEDTAAFVTATGELLGDAGVRARLGSAARRHCCARFTIDAVVPQWTSVFGSVVR